MKVERWALVTPEDCQMNRDTVFLFGDNEERWGMGGQACIRNETNAVGIRTKRKPSWDADAFWSDDSYDNNCRMIDEDIARAVLKGSTIVIPTAGLGTGRAELPKRAPRTYAYLQAALEDIARGCHECEIQDGCPCYECRKE